MRRYYDNIKTQYCTVFKIIITIKIYEENNPIYFLSGYTSQVFLEKKVNGDLESHKKKYKQSPLL